MENRQLKLSLILAMALSAPGCVGQTLDPQGGDEAPDATDAQDGADDPDESIGTAEPEPEDAPADVAPSALVPDGEGHAVSEQAECLTFFTAEEGTGSEEEGALAAATTAPRIVFLNRRGGTYTPGRNNASTNTSSIPRRTVRVAPYEGTDAEWQRVLSCVQSQFTDYNLTITDRDPGSATHIEAVVGDGPEALDLGRGVGGISPFTCGVVERSIVYVFSRVLRSVQSECEVIAHEIGHSLGLEHEYLCQDPMTYLNGCGAKTFQNRAASCGTYSAVNCQCGRPTQNTVQKLLANVGAANDEPEPPTPEPGDAPPTARVLSPANGATVPGNTDLDIEVQFADDQRVVDVRLLWEFQGTRTLSCANAVAPVRCVVQGDRARFTLPVGTGPRAFVAEAVDSANQTGRSERVTLTLSAGPVVDAAPVVALTAPSAGTNLVRGSRVAIRATATDDRAVREVTLEWTSPGGVQLFRLDNLGNGTFGVDLSVSAAAQRGTRTLRITAVDDAGQRGVSEPVTVNVQ